MRKFNLSDCLLGIVYFVIFSILMAVILVGTVVIAARTLIIVAEMTGMTEQKVFLLLAAIGVGSLSLVLGVYCAGICLWVITLLWSKVIVFVLDNFQPLEYGIAGELNKTIREYLKKDSSSTLEPISHGKLVSNIIDQEISGFRIQIIKKDVGLKEKLSEAQKRNLSAVLGEKSKRLIELLESSVDQRKFLQALKRIRLYRHLLIGKRFVVNISFGSCGDNPQISRIIEKLLNKGVIVVAASGNDNVQTPTFPSNCIGVISVAAASLESGKAPYSNFGKHIAVCADGRVEVKVLKEKKTISELSESAIKKIYEDFVRSHQDIIGRERAKVEGISYLAGISHIEFVKGIKAEGTSFAAPRVTALIAEVMAKGVPPQRTNEIVKEAATRLESDGCFTLRLLGCGQIDKSKALNSAESEKSGLKIIKVLLFLAVAFLLYIGWVKLLDEATRQEIITAVQNVFDKIGNFVKETFQKLKELNDKIK